MNQIALTSRDRNGNQAAASRLSDTMEEMWESSLAAQEFSDEALARPQDRVRFHNMALSDNVDNLVFLTDHLLSDHPWNDYVEYLLHLFEEAGGKRDLIRTKHKLAAVTFVENPGLRCKFDHCKYKLEKKMESVQREYILYHGPSADNAKKIIQFGFNPNCVQSSPYGFFLASHPGLAMGFGGPDKVVLVCKVLLGEVKPAGEFTPEDYRRPDKTADTLTEDEIPIVIPAAPPPPHILNDPAALEQFQNEHMSNYLEGRTSAMCWTVVAPGEMVAGANEGCFDWASPQGAGESLSRKVFVVQRPEQILPIGILRFQQANQSNLDIFLDEQDDKAPCPEYTSPSVPPPRLVTPARLKLDEVDAAVASLRRAALERPSMPKQTREEIASKTDQVEMPKARYTSALLCAKCGFEDSKVISFTFENFLKFHDGILGVDAEDRERQIDSLLEESDFFNDCEEEEEEEENEEEEEEKEEEEEDKDELT